MPDNNLMSHQQHFFTIGIDIEIRILLIQIVDGDTINSTDIFKQSTIRFGFFKTRMAKRIRILFI